jgi:GNAT superfamily N-acetyltransferase
VHAVVRRRIGTVVLAAICPSNIFQRMIRKANISDVVAIGNVLNESREKAYRGVLSDDVVDWMRHQMDTPAWEHYIRSPKTKHHEVIVYEHDGQIISYADYGCAESKNGRATGEIFSIFVLPDYWKRGVGREMMEYSEVQLLKYKYLVAELWVLEVNLPAQKMYSRLGWKHDQNIRSILLGKTSCRQIQFQKPLKILLAGT